MDFLLRFNLTLNSSRTLSLGTFKCPDSVRLLRSTDGLRFRPSLA